jgi:hypothetical protein
MERALAGDDSVAIHGSPWRPGDETWRAPQRTPWWAAVVAVVTLTTVLAGADRWLRVTTLERIPPPPMRSTGLFAEPIVLSVTISAAGQRAPWVTTDQELRRSVEMWRRMHLADWNAVPGPLRAQSLGNMLRLYHRILNNPPAWDEMTADDWDAVPQPIRTVAYRRMVAYWSGFYDVGAAFELPAPLVHETLAAIVMAESWFDHRARSINRDGTWDVGLGQASPFARQRLRELATIGIVDAKLGEDDYYNPWMATRFVALWMRLMLEEADGDLDMAVRAYNRGTGDAADRLGADYLAAVQRRRAQYIRNLDAPASWDFIWRRSRELVRMTPPDSSEGGRS